jgi:hypothetical protein
MKPVLKALGSVLLKLRYHGPLSNFAFNFNLRRYTLARDYPGQVSPTGFVDCLVIARFFGYQQGGLKPMSERFGLVAGAYTRPLFGST